MMAVECVQQRGETAGKLVRLAKVLAATLKGLLTDHGSPIAFHGRTVGGDELRRHHALQLVARIDTDKTIYGGRHLAIARLAALELIKSRELPPKAKRADKSSSFFAAIWRP